MGRDERAFGRDTSEYDRDAVAVRAARARVRKVLGSCPRVDDIELAVSELAGNIVQHGTGSWFELDAQWCDGFAHVEIISPAAPGWAPTMASTADVFGDEGVFSEAGRGLWLVANFSDSHGHRERGGAAIDWVEFAWIDDPTVMEDIRTAWLTWSATGYPVGVAAGP